MAESFVHRLLIDKAFEKANEEIIGSSQVVSYVSTKDLYSQNIAPEMSLENGKKFYPDFFIKEIAGRFEIIGEAKLTNDIDNQHSINQFQAYVNYGASKYNTVYLVIAAPYGTSPRIKSVLRNKVKIENQNKLEIIIWEF